MFKQINLNPLGKSTGDCVIRALSVLLTRSWNEIYLLLCVYGYMLKDWGSSNSVWDRLLKDEGFKKSMIPDTCPDCYTIKDFCTDIGNDGRRYLVATGSHVVAVINGFYYDSWDSGDEIPLYYYWK